MKSPLGLRAAVAGGRAAFTLIELLAVMAIILILAGLIINIAAGSAQYNSAKARATSEIKAMSTALENYKSDNGAYPTDSSKTETLDAQKNFDPTNTLYLNSSEFLFQELTGQASGAATVSKSYMNFTVQQLHVAADSPATATTINPNSAYNYIIDPFGFSYGYSTIYAATLTQHNSTTPPTTSAITVGYNPTFDLWSTAGYATGGKSTPTTTPPGATTAGAVYSTLWVKNW